MVAQVAAEEPDTAAKMAQPTTLTCSSRPGSRCSHGARPSNMSSAQTGAVEDLAHPDEHRQGGEVPRIRRRPHRASPAPGRAASRCLVRTATSPTAASDSAIHTPEPRMANSSRIRTAASPTRSMVSAFLAEGDGVFGGAEGRPAATRRRSRVRRPARWSACRRRSPSRPADRRAAPRTTPDGDFVELPRYPGEHGELPGHVERERRRGGERPHLASSGACSRGNAPSSMVTRICAPDFSVPASARKLAPPAGSRRSRRATG